MREAIGNFQRKYHASVVPMDPRQRKLLPPNTTGYPTSLLLDDDGLCYGYTWDIHLEDGRVIEWKIPTNATKSYHALEDYRWCVFVTTSTANGYIDGYYAEWSDAPVSLPKKPSGF